MLQDEGFNVIKLLRVIFAERSPKEFLDVAKTRVDPGELTHEAIESLEKVFLQCKPPSSENKEGCTTSFEALTGFANKIVVIFNLDLRVSQC